MNARNDDDPFAAPLLDETAPPKQIEARPNLKNLPGRIEKSPRYPDFVRALRALNWRQRKFVKLLPKANYVAAVALTMLPEASLPSIYRWLQAPKVKAAIELQMECAGDAAGIDPVRVVLQISDWANYCREEIQLYTRDGKPMGTGRRDAANALRALEMLAKHVGVIKPADNRSTTINNNAPTAFIYKIITVDGAEKELAAASVIDAECTEVKDNPNG